MPKEDKSIEEIVSKYIKIKEVKEEEKPKEEKPEKPIDNKESPAYKQLVTNITTGLKDDKKPKESIKEIKEKPEEEKPKLEIQEEEMPKEEIL